MSKTLHKKHLNRLISMERYVPEMRSPEISYEHWHRYLSIIGLVSGKNILDLGCGDGYGTNLIANFAISAIGVDINKDIIRMAQKKYIKSNLRFLVSNVDELGIKGNNIFDIVVAFEIIEHLTVKQQVKFIKEVKRVIKEDGMFIVSTPNKVKFSEERNYKNPYHKKEYKKPEFMSFLQNHFKYVSLFGQKIYPASFIWSDNQFKDHECYIEYKITNDKEGFRFNPQQIKNPMMMIAICSDTSNSNIKESNRLNSVCIDINETLIKNREEEIKSLKKVLKEKDKIIHQNSEFIDSQERRIAEIYKSKGWKLLSLLVK